MSSYLLKYEENIFRACQTVEYSITISIDRSVQLHATVSVSLLISLLSACDISHTLKQSILL